MAPPVLITSPANPLLKEVKKAVTRSSLTSDGLLVAETFHLLEEALRSELEAPVVIAAEGVKTAVEHHVRGLSRIRVVVVPDRLLPQISGTESPQGVITLVRPPQWKIENLFGGVPLVVVLDGVQDPGNGGTIVRAAEAFGASGVMFLKGTVSPFHPKTVRASAGSLFRIPFVYGVDAELGRAVFRQRKVKVYMTDPRAKTPLGRADLRSPAALVIGSEAHGAGAILTHGSTAIRIPTRGVESLNAAAAAAVVLYEASRQRHQA